MSPARIGRSLSTIAVEPRRARETPPPAISFRQLLRGGANLLLSGARVATSLVGGPLLSAAVTAPPRPGADSPSVAPPGDQPLDGAAALQKERIGDDLKLLALQSEIQRHDRQIALVSNVMKARHDTAKAAIGNIRS